MNEPRVMCNDCGQQVDVIASQWGPRDELVISHPLCPHTLRRDGAEGEYEAWLSSLGEKSS